MLRTTYTMNFRQPSEDEAQALPSSPTRKNLKQKSSSRRKLTSITPMMSDALMEVVGRSKSKRSLSPKLKQCSAKNLKVGLNQIKTMVGQVISVEKPQATTRSPRQERPFCSSSITLPDFDQESLILAQNDRFSTGSSEEMSSSFQNQARISGASSSAMIPPPPVGGLNRQTTSDSQPSQPKRRSSTTISISGSGGVGVPSMPRRRSSRTAIVNVVQVGGNQPSLPLRRSSSPIVEEDDDNHNWLSSLSDDEEEEEV